MGSFTTRTARSLPSIQNAFTNRLRDPDTASRNSAGLLLTNRILRAAPALLWAHHGALGDCSDSPMRPPSLWRPRGGAAAGSPRTTDETSGRGTFDRGDLKDVADSTRYGATIGCLWNEGLTGGSMALREGNSALHWAATRPEHNTPPTAVAEW